MLHGLIQSTASIYIHGRFGVYIPWSWYASKIELWWDALHATSTQARNATAAYACELTQLQHTTATLSDEKHTLHAQVEALQADCQMAEKRQSESKGHMAGMS